MSIRLAVLAALIAATAGCAQHPTSPMQSSPSTVLKTVPADGATAVRLDASTSLSFGVAVDRNAVESGFHLVSEADMAGTCPDASMGPHGSMDAVMNDPAMLEHMDAFHATAGRFAWNDAGTACTFMPDSLMRPDMQYMMHMSRDMLAMMSRMGGAMPAGQMTGSGDMVAHFQTTTADDHDGHH